MHKLVLAIGFASSMWACGDDPAGGSGADAAIDGSGSGSGDAGVIDNPGTGTSTLVVDATASAEPSVVNSADPSNFTTTFAVRVTKDATDITTGTVSITSSAGSVALLFDTTTMRWRGAQAGYFQNYSLDVTSGADNVAGVTVHGPDIHTITAPATGATVDSEVPLAITWARTEMAEGAVLRTREINNVAIEDSGTYMLAMNALRSKPNETEVEEVEITRSQRITPAGGAAGSSFRVTIRNGISLVVQATNP